MPEPICSPSAGLRASSSPAAATAWPTIHRRRLIEECAACGRQHSLLGRHDLRADQDRAGALVSRHLAGDLEQRRDLRHGAAAPDGLRQLSDRLELAAQDPQGHGRTRSRGAARGAGSRPTRRCWVASGRASPAAAPPARRWSPVQYRRHPGEGPRAPARPAAARGRRRRLGRKPGGLPRRQRGPARRGDHRRLAGLCRAGRGRLRPRRDQSQHVPGAMPCSACRPSTWSSAWPNAGFLAPITVRSARSICRPTLGQRYVFRFNRRTAKSVGHRFARLVEQGHPRSPHPPGCRAIVGQTGAA